MRFNALHHRKWILGFVLACLLLWQALSAWHFHSTQDSYLNCEVCSAVAAASGLGVPPPTLAVVAAVQFLLLSVLILKLSLVSPAQFFLCANPSRAPPTR